MQWRRDQKFFPTARPERMEKKINAVNGTIHIKELYALKIDLYILSVFRKSLVISKRPFLLLKVMQWHRIHCTNNWLLSLINFKIAPAWLKLYAPVLNFLKIFMTAAEDLNFKSSQWVRNLQEMTLVCINYGQSQ